MTSVPWLVLTVRSYRSVSRWTRTAVTVSAWFLPVLVSAAWTLAPFFTEEIGAVLPSASSTRVPAVNDSPPHDGSTSPWPVPPWPVSYTHLRAHETRHDL